MDLIFIDIIMNKFKRKFSSKTVSKIDSQKTLEGAYYYVNKDLKLFRTDTTIDKGTESGTVVITTSETSKIITIPKNILGKLISLDKNYVIVQFGADKSRALKFKISDYSNKAELSYNAKDCIQYGKDEYTPSCFPILLYKLQNKKTKASVVEIEMGAWGTNEKKKALSMNTETDK